MVGRHKGMAGAKVTSQFFERHSADPELAVSTQHNIHLWSKSGAKVHWWLISYDNYCIAIMTCESENQRQNA